MTTTPPSAGKRFHVHVSVADLAGNIRYYSALFGAAPTVIKPDYAKWMLDDPRLNFAISARGAKPGLDHLGLQVDSAEELAAQRQGLQEAELALAVVGETTCCYARSDKHWSSDPQGIAWETFQTLGTAPTFNGGAGETTASACCPVPAETLVALPVGSEPKIDQGGCAPRSGCC